MQSDSECPNKPTAEVFGLPYRIFVCGLGIAIAMLSVTGVYIWWKKRRLRRNAVSRLKLAGIFRRQRTYC